MTDPPSGETADAPSTETTDAAPGESTVGDDRAPDPSSVDALDGRPIEEAVELVRERRPDGPDPATARETLAAVAEDGVVSRAAASSTAARAAKVLATAETRVELAGAALDGSRAAADPVADLGAVWGRLDRLEARLVNLRGRAAGLGDRLSAALDADDLYATAEGLRSVTAAAERVRTDADDLSAELGEFRTWLADPAARRREFAGDADAVGAYLDALADDVDRLVADLDRPAGDADRATAGADRTTADDGPASPPDGDGPGGVEADTGGVEAGTGGTEAGAVTGGGDAGPDAGDPAATLGRRWADCRLRARVAELLVADLRAELSDLREWPTGAVTLPDDGPAGDGPPETPAGAPPVPDGPPGGDDPPTLSTLADRVDDLSDRHRRTADRVAAAGRPAFRERFGDRLRAADREFDAVDLPVAWGRLRATVDDHRTALGVDT